MPSQLVGAAVYLTVDGCKLYALPVQLAEAERRVWQWINRFFFGEQGQKVR